MPPELVLDDAGLDADPFFLEIGLEDAVHVLGEVDVDRVAHGLAGQAGGSAPRQNGDFVAGAEPEQLPHVAMVLRDDRADGFDLPDRCVGGVEDLGIRIEANLAFDPGGDLLGEVVGIRRHGSGHRAPLDAEFAPKHP